MSASRENFVPAAAPLAATHATSSTPRVAAPVAPASQLDEAGQARVALWAKIVESGGIDAWVTAQLKSKGLLDSHGDPSRLSEKQKADYKERKKNEAAERRSLRRQAWAAYRETHIVHLGVGVHWRESSAVDRFDLDRRTDRAALNGLTHLETIDDLSRALSLPIAALRWFAFHREVDTGSHYRTWTIPKRDGSARTITSPKRKLKAAQRWVLRNVLDRLPVHGAAHGFLAGRSIVSNASLHAGADVVIKVDIKDFFPTVTWRRVRGVFRKAGLSEQVATVLALLCTEAPRELVDFRGRVRHVAVGPRSLPQGAPTSPALTNILCARLDRRMSGLARTFGFRFTRYADDLTFSWHRPSAPSDEFPRAPVAGLLHGVREILRAEGFNIHPSKTRISRAGGPQMVTGLVVNQCDGALARVPRDTIRALRAAIHNREKGRVSKPGETLAQLKGLAAFVHMTDPVRGRAFIDKINALERREGSTSTSTDPTPAT